MLTAVTYLDGAGEEHTLPAAACALTYRHSRFLDRRTGLSWRRSWDFGQEMEAIRAHGRTGRQAAGRSSPWVAQRGRCLQAAGGPLRRRVDRGVRPQGRGDRWSPGVRKKHAGFVVNRGGATADDVRRLMALVQETVLRETERRWSRRWTRWGF